MDSKLKHLNDVVPRGDLIGIPTDRKLIEHTNEFGDVLGSEPAPFDATCPLDKDDQKVVSRCIGLTLNPDDVAGFAAMSSLLDSTNQVKTSGLSPVGSDDASAMATVKSAVIKLNEQSNE